MVGRLIVMLTLLFITATQAMAADALRVEPDRTSLHENETLTLTVIGDMALTINFDILFNLGSLDLPAPNINKLEKSFKILSREQKYSIRTVNGETRATITWTYQLAPLKTGQLTIPALTFNNSSSRPINITVKPGNATTNNKVARDAFIELSTDKDSVYVQEQLVLTVKLFFTGNLIRGDLSEPTNPDSVIEAMGKQKEYSRYRDGQRYQVVERRYAIYPQKAGKLALDPIRFEGQSRTNQGQLRFLKDHAELFDIPVKAPPASFTGDTWLPASSLSISESGVSGQSRMKVGESLTRTIVLTADGLRAEVLPPIKPEIPDGLKSYPEAPETSTDIGEDAITGRLTQTTALVGLQPGEVTLPEIRIPWWNTEKDEQEVAVIPAQTLTVAATGSQVRQPPAAGSPPTPDKANSAGGDLPPDSKGLAGSAEDSFWPWLSGLLALGWMATLALWFYRRKTPAATPKPTVNPHEAARFQALCKAAREGSADTLTRLPEWLRTRHPQLTVTSVSDVVRWADRPALKSELDRLQARLFGANPEGGSSPWKGDALIKELEQLRDIEPADTGENPLPPLYRDDMNPRSSMS